MKKVKFIQQYDEKDCGPTCLAMISQYYGKRVSVPHLRELAKTDKLGTNLLGLTKAAEVIGLQLTGVQVDSINELKSVSFPIIAHVINEQGYDHFVIVENIQNHKLHIVDPAKGKYVLSENKFKKIWTNIAVLIEKEDNFSEKTSAPSYMVLFYDILKENKTKIIILTLLSLFINLIGILGAVFLKYLTDYIIPSQLSYTLHWLGLSILLIYLLNTMITYIRYQMNLKLSLTIDMQLMKRYFYHVLYLPSHFFDTRKSGEILQRFMDTSKIREALSSSTLTLIVDTLMIVIGAVLLYLQSGLLLLVTVIFIPFFIIGAYTLKKPYERYNQKVAENDAELSSYLIESFDGYQTIKSYQSEEDNYQKGVYKFNDLIDNLLKLGRFSNIQLSFNHFLKVVMSIIILWVGGAQVIKGEMSLGSLLAFNALTIYYLEPIERLINVQPTLQSSFVAARRISEVIGLEREESALLPTQPYEFKNEIEIKNITFQYGFRNITLDNVSLTIKKGQKVAIVGESGSGKTTIGKLLTRFYKVDEGSICIDKTPITHIPIEAFRQNIGYVTQETFLFADTIRNNLLYGTNQNKDDDEMINACHLSNALNFIEKLPNQFNTMLEKGGSNLSGGQAQRLSLARTLLKNPEILILDEATSALDSITESRIMKNIDRLIRYEGKTAIIISHKLSTVKNADVIYVLKDGKIVEYGRHDDLIKQQQAYYQLWCLQKI
ncbi:peptide cleavage/export ABC transporter [Staphylococcus felis]|uniref:peptidase domain-containing ABC transporter n=1 Tax=Staphylococcus felis TaxID=46127 RepID=UPI000E28BC28|nr:peptidase domain-containing ABC transporter [Staphylococcus felis]REH91092.1 peptide cleavage/export ABC transporter [Staphylococcus felis]